MKSEFKVGDKVKIIDNFIFNLDLDVGDVGDIVNINESEIIINFHKEGCEEQTCDLVYASQYIEPIEKDLASEDLEDCIEYGLKGCRVVTLDDKIVTLDERIKYHEEELAKLKAQKEKEKWQFTEDEKVILRNLPEEYNYITRDDLSNRIFIFVDKPYKEDGEWTNDKPFNYLELRPFQHLFQCIQFTDTEPCEFRKYI